MHRPKAIDLFCGAGGLSEGLRQAGFDIVAGNDFDQAAGETFKASHPSATFFGGPIENVSIADILRATGLQVGELDVLAGGPPCQGYSVYNHKRSLDDLRTKLYLEYIRIVDGLRPKFLVMENVKGMLTDGAAPAKEIVRGLAEIGYDVSYEVHNAEEYGVPQERRRVLFLGNRIGAPLIWPTRTHGPGLRPFVTVGQAIGDLPALDNGGSLPATPYASAPLSEFQRHMRDGSDGMVRNQATTRLGKVNMDRMKHVPAGGSWRDIPFEMLPPGMKTAKRSDHTKRYGRLLSDGLSSTILTKADIHWGTFYHPTQERVISVREAARLQSFPDHVEFKGSVTEQYVQIGNAVPPLLGRAIGHAVLAALEPVSMAA